MWPVLVLAAVMGLAHLIVTPAFWPVDELSHIAYADQLATTQTLPRIDSPIPADLDYPGFSDRLQWERDERHAGRQDIWTSNHPPLPYAIQGAALAVGSWAAGGTGGLVLARLTSVAWLVVGVWATMQLAFLVAPRRAVASRRMPPSAVAYASGTLVAVTPTLSHLSGLVFNDVPAFAMSTLSLWLGARIAFKGLTPQRLAWLGLVGGLAGLTRVSCLPAVGLSFLLAGYGWWRRTETSGMSWQAYGGATVLAIIALIPALAFWLRNLRLYGSVTATGWLFEKFGRDLNDPVTVLISDQDFWARLWNRMFADLTTGHWSFGTRAVMTQSVLFMVLAGLGWWLIKALRPTTGPSDGGSGSPSTLSGAIRNHPRRIVGSVLTVLPVTLLVTTIGFHSAGGSLHGRYMLGGHAVMGLGIVLLLDQIPRVGRFMVAISTMVLFVVDAALVQSLVMHPVKPWAAAGATLNLPRLFGGATQALAIGCIAVGAVMLMVILWYGRRAVAGTTGTDASAKFPDSKDPQTRVEPATA